MRPAAGGGVVIEGRLTVVDANNFTISINTTGFSTFTGDTGGITRVGAPPAPSTPSVEPAVVPPVVGSDAGENYRYDDGTYP